MMASAGSPPLAGIVVLDLTQIYNGPYAAFLLAAAGAEVIKIEPPGGEHLRRRTGQGAATLPFAMLNAGKRSLRLDLKTPRGREILLRLAERADVLMENFAPGVMARLGLGPEALRARNPRLILASGSGYGSDGPYRDYPAMDLTVQAMSGFMSITGYPDQPPVKAGPAVCDFLAGTHLYAGIVTAIAGRERTGHAARVEVSMLESSYFSLASSLGLAHGGKARRTGNRHTGLTICPYNVYPAADGHIAVLCNNDTHWRALATAFGREDLIGDRRCRTNADRVRHMDVVDGIVASLTRPLPRRRIQEMLNAARVPCAPVREIDEVVNDPHLHARGALRWVEHPEFGRIAAAASPLRFDGMAALPDRPSAKLGVDGRTVLRERLGLSEAELTQLEDERVI